ncbi:MAG: phenylphosphate carboxylase subunit delta [Candidatus Omnitrophica bacterium]|nr:phenylphosphate carboxylase subunit delta [Candidatus Omnitrophota bacterium]
MISQDILERAKRVRLLIIDIDGVMTDGRIVYSIYGDELKFFDVTDGFGISLLRAAGIPSVIITAKKSRIVTLRARDMRVAKTYQGYLDKVIPFEKILKRFKVAPDSICFVGDDLIDIPVLKRGAVREVCDIILKSQGKWEEVAGKFIK